jgi:cathepsin L
LLIQALKFNTLDERKRFLNFRENYLKVISHNAKYYKNETTFLMGINSLSILSHDEYVKTRLGVRYTNKTNETIPRLQKSDPLYQIIEASGTPSSVDWVRAGGVSTVRNQHDCGSCWSFAAMGVIESMLLIKQKKSVVLSTQELVDCTYMKRGFSSGLVNYGCSGGNQNF